MQLEHGSLSKALSLLDLVLGNNSNPLLVHLRLECRGDRLSLQTTNGSSSLEVTLPFQGAPLQEAVLVPATPFRSLVKTFSSQSLELDLQEKLELRGGTTKAKLATAVPDGFPILFETWPESDWLELGRQEWAKLFTPQYAAATESYRSSLAGMQLAFDKDGITSAASDGFRLAEAHVDKPLSLQGRILLTPKLWRIVDRIAGEDLHLAVVDHTLFVRSGEVRFSTPVLEGALPDYHKVIPSIFSNSFTVRREALLEVLKRAMVLSGEHTRVDITLGEGELVLNAQSPNGQIATQVEAQVSKAGLSFSINGGMLLEALEHFASAELTAQLTGASTPLVIKDDGLLALLVPLRT